MLRQATGPDLIWQEYSLIEKEYTAPIDFGIAELDLIKYSATIYERRAISRELSTKEIAADELKEHTGTVLWEHTGTVLCVDRRALSVLKLVRVRINAARE